MRRHARRDDRWHRIGDLLPGRLSSIGMAVEDDRLFVEAAVSRYRAGIAWRDLPERFGEGTEVRRRFSRWAQSGVWERLFQRLCAEADDESAMIDATIVRAQQHSAVARKAGADRAIGRSRGGLSTEIHALVDTLGNPVELCLGGGQAHDLIGADHLLPEMKAGVLIADADRSPGRRGMPSTPRSSRRSACRIVLSHREPWQRMGRASARPTPSARASRRRAPPGPRRGGSTARPARRRGRPSRRVPA